MIHPRECKHVDLRVVSSFESSAPSILCQDCPTLFDVPGAIQHVQTLRAARLENKRLPYAHVYIAYPIAIRVDADSSEVFTAIPDLKVEFGRLTTAESIEARGEIVERALLDRAEHGLMPPMPSAVEELQKRHPSYWDWEWDTVSVPVTGYLDPRQE